MIIQEIKKSKGSSGLCKCDVCGKEFNRRWAKVKYKKYHYCCVKCYALGKSKEMTGASNFMYGKNHTIETRKKMSANRNKYMGEKNPNWKGGSEDAYRGYVKVYMPEHPYRSESNRVLEHRLVMEKKLGRFLLPEEVVHHINGDIKDNREENLELFENFSEHFRWHRYWWACHRL